MLVQKYHITSIHAKFDRIKDINIPYYNNSNNEDLTSINIITINDKTIKIIKLFQEEKNSKTLIKEEVRKKTKTKNIIIIV